VSSDGTTARRADDQQWSVDDVSVPSRRPEPALPLLGIFSQDLGNLGVDLGFGDFDVQSWNFFTVVN